MFGLGCATRLRTAGVSPYHILSHTIIAPEPETDATLSDSSEDNQSIRYKYTHGASTPQELPHHIVTVQGVPIISPEPETDVVEFARGID
jgi:hypothetical protein